MDLLFSDITVANFDKCLFQDTLAYIIQPEAVFKCEKPGRFCNGCSLLVDCIDGEEGLEENIVEECNIKEGVFCYKDKECSTVFNPTCVTDYKFKCTAQGMFPDPFDCKGYHICAKEAPNVIDIKDHSWQCKGNYSYNMLTTYCDVKLKNDACPDAPIVTPVCTKVGQKGPLLNKSIWFNCLKTKSGAHYPELHLCANGKWFNGTQCNDH